MFRWLESRVLWGALLILGGVMFLLQNLGAFELGDLFWALLLGLAGLFFFSIFFTSRANWWALIPGFTLLSVAILIALDRLAPRLAGLFGGSIVLAGIGLSFLVIFLLDRGNWWAVIPAGVMLTLTVVAALSEYLPDLETGGIFFLGLALTFALVALLPNPAGRMVWAWIPAGILGVMGLLLFIGGAGLINYAWPVALILGGGYLVLRTLRSRSL